MSALVAFTGPPDPALLQRMIDRLAHRGCLVGQAIQTPHATIAVLEWPSHRPPGQVRSQCSSCSSASGEVVHRALSGFAFDALPWEENRLEELRGSYAWASHLEGSPGLRIARDAVGTQSLYYGKLEYHDKGVRWLVATEPKAITAEADFEPRLRPESVAQYLAFSFVPAERTMLENLYEAEAGWQIQLRSDAEPVRERTFCFEEEEFEFERSRQESDTYWATRTREVVEQAVAERLAAGTEPLVFLSGGLDSSIIAAELARQTRSPIRTFAIHFGKQYGNELEFAAAVAERIGSRHEEVLVRPHQFMPRLQDMLYHLDEPIGDPITQPNFELARHVSNFGNYVFNGEGGDPLFGGPKNLTMLLSHWYGGVDRSKRFREQAYLASYRRAYDEWLRLLTPEFRESLERWGGDGSSALENVLTPFFECKQPRSFLNKLMAINIRLKGANLILPKVDRMLAAHQMVPLSPLFDDRLTRLSFEMPPRMKLRNGIEKIALKMAYADDLPQVIIDRPKSGMRVPVHYWFQKELRRYAWKLLNPRSLTKSGIFSAERVRQLLRYETEEKSGRYGLRLWMLMTFENWRRRIFQER